MIRKMAMSATAAIVSGAIFGAIFVLTCIISAIKAVRDRKKIKERLAEKERLKQRKPTREGNNGVSIEEAPSVRDDNRARRLAHLQTHYSENGPSVPTIDITDGRNSHSSDMNGSCSDKKGVDNLTYAYSTSDIKDKQGTLQVTPQTNIVTADISTAKHHVLAKRSRSACLIEQQRHINNLSPECLAVKKLLRRHSYETAVGENSWLPIELPTFASSEAIVNTYNYGNRNTSSGSGVGCENRAYNKDERL